MSVIPCDLNEALKKTVDQFAETLRAQAHTLGDHGIEEYDFYHSGVFRGAIERLRGQFSAVMAQKREFVARVLEHMQDQGCIAEWESAGSRNRFDYTVTMPSGRVAVVELKGCLDGNNTVIFERPVHAQEFIIWSVCSNPSSDPRLNVWSGIHTRLSAEIIDKEKLVDGLIVWDWICGTLARPCPKLDQDPSRRTAVAQYRLTPPCIYLFPSSIPSVRNNANPASHKLKDLEFLNALHLCFGGTDDELHSVRFNVAYKDSDLVRTTTVSRSGMDDVESKPTPIRRK